MADDADRAGDLVQTQLDAALAEQKRKAEGLKLTPVGECHNCGEGVGPGLIYCDSSCADDHAYTLHRLAINGRR